MIGTLSLNYNITKKTHKGRLEQKISHSADAQAYFHKYASALIKGNIASNDEIILEKIHKNPGSIYGDGVFDLLRNHEDHSLFHHHECTNCDGAGKLTCPICYGRQIATCNSCSGNKTHKCSTCLGYGTVEVPFGQQTNAGYIQGAKIYGCADCAATGKVSCDGCAGSGYKDCTCNAGKITCRDCDGTGALTTEQYVVISAHLDRAFAFILDGKTYAGTFDSDTATLLFPDAQPPQWGNDDHTEIQIKLTGSRVRTRLKSSSSEYPISFSGKDLSLVTSTEYTKYLFAKHLYKLNGFFKKFALRKVEKMPFVREMILEHESGIEIQNLKAVRFYISAEQAAEFFSIRRRVLGQA